MKVLILTNLGSIEFPEHRFMADEEHEVSDKFGERLVKRGLASEVPPPAIEGIAMDPELKAVPEETQPQSKPSASAKSKNKGDVTNA